MLIIFLTDRLQHEYDTGYECEPKLEDYQLPGQQR